MERFLLPLSFLATRLLATKAPMNENQSSTSRRNFLKSTLTVPMALAAAPSFGAYSLSPSALLVIAAPKGLRSVAFHCVKA